MDSASSEQNGRGRRMLRGCIDLVGRPALGLALIAIAALLQGCGSTRSASPNAHVPLTPAIEVPPRDQTIEVPTGRVTLTHGPYTRTGTLGFDRTGQRVTLEEGRWTLAYAAQRGRDMVAVATRVAAHCANEVHIFVEQRAVERVGTTLCIPNARYSLLNERTLQIWNASQREFAALPAMQSDDTSRPDPVARPPALPPSPHPQPTAPVATTEQPPKRGLQPVQVPEPVKPLPAAPKQAPSTARPPVQMPLPTT